MSLPLGFPITSSAGGMSQAVLTPGSSPKTSRASPCCENGRPIMTNPLNGQTICSCQYNPATAAALYSYPHRLPGLPEALYNSAVAAQAQGLLPFAAAAASAGDPAAIYAGLAPAYDFKGLPSPTGLPYPFDPSLAAYPYGNGFLDPNARRKNATRESTATLKAWLSEHKKNPYPTKGEKIMLAIITKMTLTQVSTWFANARRRLKKDHKMTWEPRNRMDDDDDRDSGSDIEDEAERDDVINEDENISVDSDDEDARHPLRQLQRDMIAPTSTTNLNHHVTTTERRESTAKEDDARENQSSQNIINTSSSTDENRINNHHNNKTTDNNTTKEGGETINSPKPKIWSMAEIATSNTHHPQKSDHLLSHRNNNINSLGNPAAAAALHLQQQQHQQQSIHQNKLASLSAHALHPAWRGTHPYFQAHMLQSRLAALSAHPAAAAAAAAHRLPTANPFTMTSPPLTSPLRPQDSRNASAFVPISNIPKTPPSS